MNEFRKTKHIQWTQVGYAKCPTCGRIGLRDFQKFCDQCGQALKWTKLVHEILYKRED